MPGERIYPKTRVKVEIIGAFKCIDNGEEDDKLVGIVVGCKPQGLWLKSDLSNIKHYLTNYKSGFQVLEYVDKDQALIILQDSKDKYEAKGA
jgi:inorganic pyrophosphatase